MLFLQVMLLVMLVGVTLVAPGLFFARRFGWPPLETLTASLGISLVLVYLVSFAFYITGLPRAAFWAAGVAAAGATLLLRRDLAGLFAAPEVRTALGGSGALLAWTLGLVCLVRNYSMANWSGDWYEHYQRMNFFVRHLPRDTMFLVGYSLPARPPFMNLVESFYATVAGTRFEIYQLLSVTLNALVVFPCWLVARSLAGERGLRPVLMVGLLAANPMLVQNLTYTWTRGLATFFVLFGLYLYLEGWRGGDRGRLAAGFTSLAAGMLVHYSAGPFLVVLGLHYLVFVLPHRHGRRLELAWAAGGSAFLLATWFAWSTIAYGVAGTFGSNTTVQDSRAFSLAGNIAKTCLNVVDTVVPFPLRRVSLAFLQPSGDAVRLRDWTGLLYNCNLIFTLGSVGGLVIYTLLVRRVAALRERDLRWFWILGLPACVLLSVAVNGDRYPLGVAHICMQPLLLAGICLLAAGFPRLPAWLRWTVVGGAVIDVALGILLHFNLQNRIPGPAGEGALSTAALLNWQLKLISREAFLGDHLSRFSDELGLALVAAFALLVIWLAREARRA